MVDHHCYYGHRAEVVEVVEPLSLRLGWWLQTHLLDLRAAEHEVFPTLLVQVQRQSKHWQSEYHSSVLLEAHGRLLPIVSTVIQKEGLAKLNS